MDNKKQAPFPEPSQQQLDTIALLYRRRDKYWLDYSWKVRSEVNKLFINIFHSGLRNIQERGGLKSKPEVIREYLLDSSDKINSCFYHLERLKNEEAEIINLGTTFAEQSKSSLLAGLSGMPTEIISYEAEAFLLAFESSLEIFARGISYYFNAESRFTTLKKTLGNIKSSEPKKISLIISMLDSEKYSPIFAEISPQEKKSKRDLSTHYRSLRIAHTGLHITDKGRVVFKARFAESADASLNREVESIDDYCSRLLYLLCDLQMDILSILFDQKFVAGEKMSVLDAYLKRVK